MQDGGQYHQLPMNLRTAQDCKDVPGYGWTYSLSQVLMVSRP